MRKNINVVPHDPAWPQMFLVISAQLKDILGQNCAEVYHIGSTSVPGLCAKPVIDICCAVHELKPTISCLENHGYKYKGEFNLPLRLFFNKKQPINLNLHVVRKNNDEIRWQTTFRDYLRNNAQARALYAKTKLDLIENNAEGFSIAQNGLPEYAVLKGDVIRKIQEMANFQGNRLVIASNNYESEQYKKLLNLQTVDLADEKIFPLCLYRAVNIVAAACVEFDRINNLAFIRSLAAKSKTDEKMLREKISEWSQFHELSLSALS